MAGRDVNLAGSQFCTVDPTAVSENVSGSERQRVLRRRSTPVALFEYNGYRRVVAGRKKQYESRLWIRSPVWGRQDLNCGGKKSSHGDRGGDRSHRSDSGVAPGRIDGISPASVERYAFAYRAGAGYGRFLRQGIQ